MDFVADALTSGRRFRALTVIDLYTRGVPRELVAGQSLRGQDVVAALERLRFARACRTDSTATMAQSLSART